METIAFTLLLAGCLLLFATGRMLLRGRLVAGSGGGLLALAVLAAGFLLLGLAASFHVLDRYNRETPVATLSFEALGPGRYEVALRVAGATGPKYYRIAGDEWQLDVRFLKWKAPAVLMGARSLFQLDRLSGRHAAPGPDSELTAYGLADAPGRLLWQLASGSERWLPWLDAVYGTGVFLPMADGALYEVRVNASGLVARPANAAARRAVAGW